MTDEWKRHKAGLNGDPVPGHPTYRYSVCYEIERNTWVLRVLSSVPFDDQRGLSLMIREGADVERLAVKSVALIEEADRC